MRSLFAGIALALVACSASPADDSESADDALSSFTVEHLAPTEDGRTTTARVAALVGEPIEAGRTLKVTRTLVFAGRDARVVVDTTSFATALVAASDLAASSRPADVQNTPFAVGLAHAHDALEHLDPANRPAAESFALTIDMCQSHKPWEKRLFDWVVAHANEIHAPVPIGIAMTGVWAKAHPTELDQLLGWQRENKIAITWINHSSTHPLHCLDAACRNAKFLTDPSVDMNEEVLGLERTLIARGIAPSVLFRFPGLVHDRHRLDQLAPLSLVALDANAWIAKDEPIRPGAVVLVHGNGNEPEGITAFLRQVQSPSRASALRSGKSAIVPPLGVIPR